MAEWGVDQSQTIGGELRGLMAAKPEVYQPKSGSGLWGMAKMIEDGSKWTLNIPETLKAGQVNYSELSTSSLLIRYSSISGGRRSLLCILPQLRSM